MLLFQKYLKDFDEVFILKPTVNLDKNLIWSVSVKHIINPGLNYTTLIHTVSISQTRMKGEKV